MNIFRRKTLLSPGIALCFIAMAAVGITSAGAQKGGNSISLGGDQPAAVAGLDQASENSAEVHEIERVLNEQSLAWNRGDLDAFMTAYLKSPETSYISSCGTGSVEVWGYEALRQRYQKKYGASHESMGTLTMSNEKVYDLGRGHALCIGNFKVERAAQPAAQGIFSLVLTKTSDGWKVIHDHTSVFDEKTSG